MLKAITLLLLLALASCSSKPTPTQTDTPAEPTIIGTWHWKESISAWRPDTLTPARCGCTSTLRFRADSTFDQLENDNVVTSGPYALQRGHPNYPADSSLWIKYDIGGPNGLFGPIPVVLTNTLLEFDSRAWDGPLERYTR